MQSSNSSIKLALIADDLTHACLARECKVYSVTPWNFRWIFKVWKPDILFVESSWHGRWGSWRYKVASYPDVPRRNNSALVRIIECARSANLPAVFWNREDGVHFQRFIDSAMLFDRVFTVDEEMIPRYRAMLGSNAKIETLPFAVQPAMHSPSYREVLRRASFVGSYSTHVHPERRAWQDMMFRCAKEIGLVVYDRNSHRRAASYRYPNYPWMDVKEAVPHGATAEIYRTNAINLNVNTITNSTTAFSRRLVEILGTGGFAVTNPTPAVARFFGDYCAMVSTEDEATDLYRRVSRDGLSQQQREQARAGADYVQRHHTWRHRLEQIVGMAA